MNILDLLPDSHAGRHTKWLWSRMLAMEAGARPSLDPAEVADHFAPSVLDHVPAEHLVAYFSQLASAIPVVTQLIQETSTSERYSALLATPTQWLRYRCLTQATAPHLLIEAAYALALEPTAYSDRRIQRDGRDVLIRDFGGTGPLLLLWHGAGCDLTCWESIVPHLAGFHVIAQDLPGHGRSRFSVFTTNDAFTDAGAVIAEIAEGPPIVVGHSLGGYLGLRYAATGKCSGWIGLDGPFAVVYPWEPDEPGVPDSVVQIGREIRAVDVVRNLAEMNCPGMLILCSIAANALEERIVADRQELAKYVARHHPDIRIEWVETGHDTLLFHNPEKTAAWICDWSRKIQFMQ
jgi:pimeloyl-ACP methyl ester carboxylesterase